MKRRDVLPAMGALPVADLGPAAACDPVLPLYRAWVESRATWWALADLPGNEAWDHPYSMASEQAERDALHVLAAIEPLTPDGLAAALHVLWVEIAPWYVSGADDLGEETACPAYRLFWKIGQAAARMAGTEWNPEELYGQ